MPSSASSATGASACGTGLGAANPKGGAGAAANPKGAGAGAAGAAGAGAAGAAGAGAAGAAAGAGAAGAGAAAGVGAGAAGAAAGVGAGAAGVGAFSAFLGSATGIKACCNQEGKDGGLGLEGLFVVAPAPCLNPPFAIHAASASENPGKACASPNLHTPAKTRAMSL